MIQDDVLKLVARRDGRAAELSEAREVGSGIPSLRIDVDRKGHTNNERVDFICSEGAPYVAQRIQAKGSSYRGSLCLGASLAQNRTILQPWTTPSGQSPGWPAGHDNSPWMGTLSTSRPASIQETIPGAQYPGLKAARSCHCWGIERLL